MTRYNKEIKSEILRLKALGFSSRSIANKIGISKSGVNNVLSDVEKTKENFNNQNKKPAILLFDVENAPSIVATFGRFKQTHSIDSVLEEGGWLISLAWQWYGNPAVNSAVLTPDEALNRDDSRLVALLWELFEFADIVCYQNGDNFDLPLFKTRCILNGLKPPKTVKTIDTLKIAKTLKFNSNRLDGLGKQLGVGRKIKHDGIDLWVRCMEGDEKSLEDMRAYNEGDIELLRQVYDEIKAYNPQTPNMAHYYNDNEKRCPACGSVNVVETDNKIYTPVSEFSEVVCSDCGHRSRTRQATNTKEKRNNLLITPR